ncbi:MAG: ATP synthase A1 subunit C [Methanomassiliicoccales archaeon]|nr:ATP synthase A1 subunit C [Methanomassiliicoccales archaeon]TFG56226.1 MAG: ATP synthase A1 subunit C [Methanomassiliicoccus sp.]
MLSIWGSKGNYAYVSARVKAKKTLLISKDNYPKLLLMDLNEIGRFLGETQYKVEMTELAAKYDGVNLIELGTSKNLARVFTDILNYSTGDLYEMLERYLMRWDIWNVKTVLRGKYYGASTEEIQEDIVAAGKYDEEFINVLISLEGVEEVLKDLKSKEGLTIPDDIIAEYHESKTLAPLEDYLDKLYYAEVLACVKCRDKAEGLFKAFLRKEVDVTNLMTLMKLKKEGISPERPENYFIDGGEELEVKTLIGLSKAESIDQLVSELTNYSFYVDIKDALEEMKQTGSLSPVSLAMQRHLLKRSERFSHIYPLSVLPIMDYMLRKKQEVDNIRIIARCKESDLAPDQIKKLLVM